MDTPYSTEFDNAAEHIIRQHGSLLHRSSDSQFRSRFGIMQLNFPTQNLNSLTQEHACQLMHSSVWLPLLLEDIPFAATQRMLLQAALLFGVHKTVRTVRRSVHHLCGLPDPEAVTIWPRDILPVLLACYRAAPHSTYFALSYAFKLRVAWNVSAQQCPLDYLEEFTALFDPDPNAKLQIPPISEAAAK